MAASNVKEIDHGWKDIKKMLKKMDGSSVVVGFPSETNKQHPNTDFTIAELVAVQDLGRKDGSIPARPFMEQTFEKNKNRISKLQLKLKDRVLTKRDTIRKALGKLGVWYEGEIKKEITTGTFEPLSQATIDKKNSSKPLIDEGIMRNAVTSKVRIA